MKIQSKLLKKNVKFFHEYGENNDQKLQTFFRNVSFPDWAVNAVSLQIIQTFEITGQSYEIRMLDNRKIGELPEITGKMVKVSFCFHEQVAG